MDKLSTIAGAKEGQNYMKTKLYLSILLLLIIYGCATAQSFKKPCVDFSQYKKIAIIKFDCLSDPTAGQEVADIIALEFIKRGYDVIERSQLNAIIDENILISSGLTESNKSALQLSGIDGIVVGSLSRYDCYPSKAPIYYMGKILAVLNTNKCYASLSLKMLDVKKGEVIWAANGSHSRDAVNMTAYKALQEVIDILREQIP